MARRLRAVAALALTLAGGMLPGFAQDSPTPTAKTPPATPSASPVSPPQNPRPDFQQFLNQLPPEQKARFQQNLDVWNSMTPEERKALRARYEQRRKWIESEIDNARKTAGLRLDEATQKQFTDRYMDERRKIEQTLHRELDAKRRELTKALVEKLKTEFAPKSLPPTPTPSASPQASATAAASPTFSPSASKSASPSAAAK